MRAVFIAIIPKEPETDADDPVKDLDRCRLDIEFDCTLMGWLLK